MTFEPFKRATATNKCSLRSDCKRLSDHEYFDRLFESEWSFFVIKTDESGRLRGYTECCGRLQANHAN